MHTESFVQVNGSNAFGAESNLVGYNSCHPVGMFDEGMPIVANIVPKGFIGNRPGSLNYFFVTYHKYKYRKINQNSILSDIVRVPTFRL